MVWCSCSSGEPARSSGTDDTITVDVPIHQGWNQVTWSFTETTFSIGARPIDSSAYSVPFALSF